MKKIIIDKDFFNAKSKLSKGLISNLKKLSTDNYEIFVAGSDEEFYSDLKRIFDLEDIKINTIENKSEIANPDASLKIEGNKVYNENNSYGFKNLSDAVDNLLIPKRIKTKTRKTNETDITIKINLDGKGKSSLSTGIGFFDHMLGQISKHGNVDLDVQVKGDLYVDEHHTIEDVGITLGETILEALGNKSGIQRYGFILPMDESVAVCAIDLGGRPHLNFKCKFKRTQVGELPTELVEEFFKGLSMGLKANIYLRAKGKNDHHKIESIFKAFAKSLNEACRLDERNNGKIPSTKGVI